MKRLLLAIACATALVASCEPRRPRHAKRVEHKRVRADPPARVKRHSSHEHGHGSHPHARHEHHHHPHPHPHLGGDDGHHHPY